MKLKTFAAATMIASTSLTTANAGALVDPIVEPAIIIEEAASSSSAGLLIPLLLVAVIAAALIAKDGPTDF